MQSSTRADVCKHACTHACTHTHTHQQTNKNMHTCMHTHTQTHTVPSLVVSSILRQNHEVHLMPSEKVISTLCCSPFYKYTKQTKHVPSISNMRWASLSISNAQVTFHLLFWQYYSAGISEMGLSGHKRN